MKLNPNEWTFYDDFKTDEDKRLARVLSTIILTYLTGSLILIVLDLVWGDKSLYLMLILGMIFQSFPIYFLFKKNLSACSFMVIGGYILVTTLFATIGLGVRDYVIMVYPAVIMFAGLTEKRRGLVTSTFLTLIALAWLVLGDELGWYTPLPPSPASLFDLIIISLLVFVSATAVGLLIENLESNHAQTKRELKKRINAEENLQALIENTGGSIWSVDSQYRLIIGNTSFHNNIKTASGRELVAGESVLGPEYNKNMLDEWQSYYDRALQGEKFHIQVNIQLSLQPLDMEYHFNPIRNRDGQVSGVTVFGRDITERKQTELQLRESEEQNRAIVNSVPDLLFRLQRNGTIVDYHAPHDSILFTPPEKFLNQNFEDVLPPHVAIPAKEAIEQSLATNQMVMFDYEMETNGEVRYYEDRIVPVNKEEVLSVIRDITERRWMEKQLRESEERFRRLADHAPDIIFRYNLVPEMRLSYINLAVQSITGYTPDDCYADPYLMLNMAHSDDAWKMAEYLQSKNAPEKPLLMRWVGKDGLTRWMESHIVPIHNSDGQLIAVEGITRDVTERKHAEEKLRESEEFIRNVNNNLVSGMVYQALILKDGSRKFTYLSDSVERLYGISPQQGAQDPSLIYNRIHIEDILRLRKEEEAANQTLSVFKIEVRVINPDGSIRWSSFVSNPTLWEDGTTCWNGIELDVTELKTAEEALRASETRYRLLAENISDVIWILDLNEMRFRYVSPSVERLRGFTVEEVMAQDMAEVMSPGSLQLLQENLSSRIQDFLNGVRGYYTNEVEQPCKDGSTVWTETTTSFRINETNGHLEVYGVSRNINERKLAEKALREAELRWQFALEGSGDGVWDWNLQTRQIFYSRQWKSMLGYKDEEIGNSPDEWFDRVHPNELEMVQNEIEKLFSGKTPLYISEYRILCKDGEYKWILDRGKIVEWEDNKTPLRFIGTQTDITQQKLIERQLRSQLNEIEHLQDELRQQALHDPLTNLYNRRYLTETLEREVARAQRERKSASIVIMDIDHFKKINDSYGHQVGDKFLIAIADLLKINIRGSDVACRYGGEEFLLILPGATAKVALKRAEQLREQCAEICIKHEDKELFIKMSMGIATFPTHTKDTEELLIKADKALYKSKRAGRNRVTVWSES